MTALSQRAGRHPHLYGRWMKITRTKPVEDVLAQLAEDPHVEEGAPARRLRKRLGPFDLMGFGIGIVIGTGIFTLTGIEAKNHAGPAVTISFVIAGAVSL